MTWLWVAWLACASSPAPDGTAGPEAVPAAPVAPAVLPDGWEEVFDPESGQYFYFHEASEATQWERPVVERPATSASSPERPDSTGFLGV